MIIILASCSPIHLASIISFVLSKEGERNITAYEFLAHIRANADNFLHFELLTNSVINFHMIGFPTPNIHKSLKHSN